MTVTTIKTKFPVSVIVPTWNEEKNICRLIEHLKNLEDPPEEIIVVDGGSKDDTYALACQQGVKVFKSPKKGRAAQMNYGASQASGDILYFVHADAIPPKCCIPKIRHSVTNNGPAGCFAYQFDTDNRLIKAFGHLTKYNLTFSGGGDQTLFITRSLFQELGGFKQELILMEDFEFVKRIKEQCKFRIIQDRVIVSARKYEDHSILEVQFTNFLVFTMWKLGFSQEILYKTYKKLWAKRDEVN